MASEPRALVVARIRIALVARVDIPAATRDSLFVVKRQIPVAVPADIFAAVPIDIPAVVRVEISVVVPIDSVAALRAGLTFAPGGLVANGWALDGAGAAQSSDCDCSERHMAPLPRPALS